MILLLALGCTDVEATPDPQATPEERLDALAPGASPSLSKTVALYTRDLDSVADVLEQVEPALVPMLLPKDSAVLNDDVEEVLQLDAPDIATVQIKRTADKNQATFRGRVTGLNLDTVQILVQSSGGPTPDWRYDLATPIQRGEVIAGGTKVSSSVAVPGEAVKSDKGWDFEFSVPGSGPMSLIVRAVAAPSDENSSSGGSGTTGEREMVDDAPGGVYGSQSEAVRLLIDLLQDEDIGGKDPDLLVAVALTWAPWLDLVQTAIQPTVRADAKARMRYADEVDRWLEKRAAGWTVHGLGGIQKVLWAWPGAESAVYGARPLGWEQEKLSMEAYRFHVAGVDTLRILRDDLPFDPGGFITADQRDARIWKDLDYRAEDSGMEALCDQKLLDRRTCFRWERDHAEGRSLGTVDSAPVALNLGTSAAMQTHRWTEEDSFAGDCATATTVAIAAFQAVGLAPLAIGWAGDTWYEPTHNMPLVWNGKRFAPMQAGPSEKWNGHAAFIYATLPPINAAALSLGWGGAGARGPAVPGTQTTYGELNTWLDDGIPAESVLRWLEEGRQGQWPEIQ